ncbi:glycosyltransferase [Desulfopila inferna]|nr:glycosyltransferase [Desulfopila inferna]
MAVYLANHWAARGHTIEFVLMRKEGELLSLVSPAIQVVGFEARRIRGVAFPLVKYLKRNKPDVIWAGMWPLTSAAVISWLAAGRPGKIFLMDHNQLSVSCRRELKISLCPLKALMRITYPFATGVMAVSRGVADDIRRLGNFSKDRVKVIYNPAATGISSKREPPEVRTRLWGAGFSHHILTVGSLKTQKNHELLIRAFVKIPPSLNAKLTILGEGELRPVLAKLIDGLDMQDRVSLPGFAIDPYPWFRSADLFVLSSSWEGLSNVIIEALECGLPVVSTDCPSGPAEILESGRYGKLVPVGNADALAEAMLSSLNEKHDRQALINRAKDFSVEKIAEEYLDYFRECGVKV